MSVDELGEVGMARMDDGEIREFLSSQGIGVLGLPAEPAPYLLPMSFGFDGGSAIYFTYVLGKTSRKEELTEQADTASFLVYSVDSAFHWQSALLRGSIDRVPESEWADREGALDNAWHPDLFDDTALSRGVRIYQFDIEEQSGFQHTGLPPGFER